MTPAFYVIYGIILTLLGTGLIFFGGAAYYLATALKEAGTGLGDLALALGGLPQNLHGIAPAMQKLADGTVIQVQELNRLAEAIIEANKSLPPEKPEKFDENGKDVNWTASIPQNPFEEEDRG